MKICGIVAEYNPFHSGHAFQIAKTRQILGNDCLIVAAMSGNFVQRGECAIMRKQARAKAAILGGADVILELPLKYSVSGAENFALGAVNLLHSLGNITDLCFGSECGDISLLMEIAGILQEHETVAQTIAHMKSGISYAAARERALYGRIKETSAVLSQPNNILGIEYCKAILKLQSKITPHAILRSGAAHDGFCENSKIQSASYIRELLHSGNLALGAQFMPQTTTDIFIEEASHGSAPASMKNGERAMVTYLRRLDINALAKLQDCAEGLEFRLRDAILKGSSFDEIIDLAKTKRYARSRLSRMILCAFLGIYADDAKGTAPEYANVLAFSERGREVLKTAQIPLITKPADGKAYPSFAKNAEQSDLLSAFVPNFSAIAPGADYTISPFYHK